MGGNAPLERRKFGALARRYGCVMRKTRREWEIVDNSDGMRVCGFAMVGGREIKRPYVKLFEKLILENRSLNR